MSLSLISLLFLSQVVVTQGERELKLGTEGLVLKTAGKQLTWSGAGFTGKVDGGTAFTGIAQTVTHACTDGENVDVSGTHNDITLTGKCGVVTVSGLANQVTLETAASIDVSGRDNLASWTRGDPKRNSSGPGNRVLQVK